MFRRVLREMLDKGGILAVGLGCFFLYKHQYFPKVLGPVSYGIITLGALGVGRYIIMDPSKTPKDKHEEPEKSPEKDPKAGKLREEIEEMRRDELFERIRLKMSVKFKENKTGDQQTDGSNNKDLSAEGGQKPEVTEAKLEEEDIIEKYFKGYEECLEAANFEEEEFEMLQDADIDAAGESEIDIIPVAKKSESDRRIF